MGAKLYFPWGLLQSVLGMEMVGVRQRQHLGKTDTTLAVSAYPDLFH